MGKGTVLSCTPGSRCSGQCCNAFTLPCTPEQIVEAIEHLKRCEVDPEYKATFLSGGGPNIWLPMEYTTILPMLIPIVYAMEGDQHPSNPTHSIEKGRDGWYYTCVHFDDRTGNCNIYDHRPRMCSEYPYGNTCTYVDCTMDPYCTAPDPEPGHEGERCTKKVGHHRMHSWEEDAVLRACEEALGGLGDPPAIEAGTDSQQIDQLPIGESMDAYALGSASDLSAPVSAPMNPKRGE